MDELLHAALQVGRVWIHRELRFMLHILPYHHVLTPRRRRATDREEQSAIEADLEES